MMNVALKGMPDVGNPPVRFRNREVTPTKPRCGSLLCGVVLSLPQEGGSFGVLTVKTSVADAIQGRLEVSKLKVRGFSRQIVRADDAKSGTTTFSIAYSNHGATMFLR